jgi:hypothetical protein
LTRHCGSVRGVRSALALCRGRFSGGHRNSNSCGVHSWLKIGSAARQRLMVIAAAFDLSGAPIGNWSSSTSLVRKRSIRSNQVPRPAMLPVAVGDRRFGVLVRIQYAAALNRRLSLGVVPYSECVGRSHRYRTRLTVGSRPSSPKPAAPRALGLRRAKSLPLCALPISAGSHGQALSTSFATPTSRSLRGI